MSHNRNRSVDRLRENNERYYRQKHSSNSKPASYHPLVFPLILTPVPRCIIKNPAVYTGGVDETFFAIRAKTAISAVVYRFATAS